MNEAEGTSLEMGRGGQSGSLLSDKQDAWINLSSHFLSTANFEDGATQMTKIAKMML